MSTRHVSEADRVRAALAVIPAEDYTTWIGMAFAVKAGLGEDGCLTEEVGPRHGAWA